MTVGAIVLAAGLSRRMGAAKLTLPIAGEPMLLRTLGQVASAGLPLLLVTGGHERDILKLAPDCPSVRSKLYDLGLAESLKAGLRAAPATWDAALIVLGDMPFVAADTMRSLADALEHGANAVVPTEAGRRGNPAGFARRLWPELLKLEGDQGARRVLERLGAREILVNDPGIHRDFDIPEDLNGY